MVWSLQLFFNLGYGFICKVVSKIWVGQATSRLDLDFVLIFVGVLARGSSLCARSTLELLIFTLHSQPNLMPCRSLFPRDLSQCHRGVRRGAEGKFDLECLEFTCWSVLVYCQRIGLGRDWTHRLDRLLLVDSDRGVCPRQIGLGRYRGRCRKRGTR